MSHSHHFTKCYPWFSPIVSRLCCFQPVRLCTFLMTQSRFFVVHGLIDSNSLHMAFLFRYANFHTNTYNKCKIVQLWSVNKDPLARSKLLSQYRFCWIYWSSEGSIKLNEKILSKIKTIYFYWTLSIFTKKIVNDQGLQWVIGVLRRVHD